MNTLKFIVTAYILTCLSLELYIYFMKLIWIPFVIPIFMKIFSF